MPDTEIQPTDQQLELELGWSPEPAEAPEVAAAPTTPSPQVEVKKTIEPAPTAPTPADPLADAREQLRDQQVQMNIMLASQEYQRRLVASGVDAWEAQQTAKEEATKYWNDYQQNQALNRANDTVKEALIKELSREHGVPAEMLAGFTDRASMRAAATLYGVQAKEIALLKSANASPKAPVQNFDGGSGTSGGVIQARRNDYIQGKGKALNAADFEALHGFTPI